MKIAVIGSGIAGNTAAWLLREQHDVTVYEASGYIGGHTNTADVETAGGPLAIDTGFIVFNDRTYPEFNRLLRAIGQDWQPSVMSFSVESAKRNFEYSGSSLNGLFAQRRNLLRPAFWRMVRDILRFNREGPALLEKGPGGETLGDFMQAGGYSEEFRNLYLYPMAAAIWSAEPHRVADMPAFFLLRFFQHHGLLQLKDRPQWRVIPQGSREYVRKLVAGFENRIRLNCAVRSIERTSQGIRIVTADDEQENYDQVFVACHSDQALTLRGKDATKTEQEVLGAIRYQDNEAILHCDESLMPRRKAAWAAWNYHVEDSPSSLVSVTYNMNILQSLPGEQQYLVTLNNARRIDASKILKRIDYSHPVLDVAAVSAQARHAELNAAGRIYYCGAYWRNGFHEDGVVSAIDAVRHFEEEQRLGKLHFRRAG